MLAVFSHSLAITASTIDSATDCIASLVLFGRYAMVADRRTESPTLMAEGRHREVDALSSLVVLASVIASYFKLKIDFYGVTIDQIAAVLVLLFIVHAGWEMLSNGMRVLLDASIDHQTLDEVRKIIEAEPMVTKVNGLVGRNAGRFRFLQATVAVKTDDLKEAQKVSEKNRDKYPKKCSPRGAGRHPL